MTIDIEQALSILAQVVVIAGGFVGIYWAIKRWVVDIAEDSKQAAHQLETSNGTTVARYVEDLDGKIATLLDAHGSLTDTVRDNRTRIEVLEAWRNEHLRGHP